MVEPLVYLMLRASSSTENGRNPFASVNPELIVGPMVRILPVLAPKTLD